MNASLKKKVLYRKKTAFDDICVEKEGNILTLYSPSSFKQTAINESNPFLPHLEYARNMILGLVFYPHPKSILVMGLGGGSIPMMFHNIYKQTHIDVVEIDPEIAEIAKKYFYFNTSPGLQLHIDDASLFVKKSNKRYDLIIMDAYIGNKLPRSLTTTEFFNEIKRLLSPDGVFVANIMGKSQRKFQRLLKKNGFENKEIWLLPCIRSRNIVVFASKGAYISKKELLFQSDRVQRDISFDFQLINLVRRLRRSLDFFSLTSY